MRSVSKRDARLSSSMYMCVHFPECALQVLVCVYEPGGGSPPPRLRDTEKSGVRVDVLEGKKPTSCHALVNAGEHVHELYTAEARHKRLTLQL